MEKETGNGVLMAIAAALILTFTGITLFVYKSAKYPFSWSSFYPGRNFTFVLGIILMVFSMINLYILVIWLLNGSNPRK